MIPPKIDYIYIITYFQKSITYQPLFKTEPNFILAAFCGIYIVMYIANKFKNKYVQSVGMSSLIIMLVHEPIKRVIIKVMELLLNIEGEILRKSIVFSLLITLIIILVSIIIEKIIINYFPYIIGKNNKDKRYILSKFYKINNT